MTDSEPARLIYIDGRPARVYERVKPIPPRLELLLEGGRDATGRLWGAMRVIHRLPLRLRGSSAACAGDDHAMTAWIEGFHTGSDARVRHLRLQACTDCGAVCVRDISVDQLPGIRPGRLAPRRRDNVIGWYTGARPRQRVYT